VRDATSAIETFLRAVDAHSGLWQSIDIRCISVPHGEQLYNLASRAYLDSRAPGDIESFATQLPTDSPLRLIHHVTEIAVIRKFLEGLAAGRLTLDNTLVLATPPPGLRETRPDQISYTFHDLHTLYVPSYPYWSNHELRSDGQATLAELLRYCGLDEATVNNALRSDQRPSDGIAGLLKYFLGSRTDDLERRYGVEVIAPLEVLFDEERCRLHGGQLDVHVRAGSPKVLAEAHVGVFAHGFDGVPASFTVVPNAVLHEDHPTAKDHELGHINVQCDKPRATLFLRVGNVCVNRIRLTDPAHYATNPRVLAYDAFDPGQKKLVEWIEATQKKADKQRDFEHAVARLFYLLGMQTDVVWITDAVDVMVLDMSIRVMLAVECTVGPVDSDKISKLAHRTRALEDVLPAGFNVIAVLATSLKVLEEPERVQAGQNKIAILLQQDLLDFLQLASPQSVSSVQITDMIKRKIPSVTPRLPFL